MKTAATAIIGMTLLASSLGCAICDSSLDNHFASYGGVIERTDPQRGRVGSSVDPASAPVGILGVVDPEQSEASAFERPRDLQPNGVRDSGVQPLVPGDRTPDSGDPTSESIEEMLELIPDLDEQRYQDLLDEMPGDDSESSTEFPGEVTAVPIRSLVDSDSVEAASFTKNSEDDNQFSLIESAADTSIIEQLGGVIVDD